MIASGIEIWCVGKRVFGGLATAGATRKEPQPFWESPLFPLILVVLICFLVIRLESQSKSDKQSRISDRIESTVLNKKPALATSLASLVNI